MDIAVFGKGCRRCHELAANAQQALKDAGIDATVGHVTDMQQITEKGVMVTPALVIDGTIKSEGKVLGAAEIKEMLTN